MNSARAVTCGLAAVVVVLPLAACSGDEGSDDSAGPTVVASAYPFAFVAERVGGDLVSVENLTSTGTEPHDVELAPQQVADVSEADLLVYESSFQPSVDEALGQAGLDDDQVLDVADVVTLLPTGTGETGDADDAVLDPHVWLDPTNMVVVAEAVADRLADADPDHTRTYRDNASRLVDDLTAVDAEYRQGLAECQRDTVVTTHDAFGYLATRYDLTMVPIAGIDPTQEPSPAQQAEIADVVESEDITTVFTEELVSPAVAQSIADETGATLATLSPIEGLSDETADDDYLSLMRANLQALELAGGCS